MGKGVFFKCSVKCPKCGQRLEPAYFGEDNDFLVGGWCPKCKKHYPLVPTDIDTAYELYGGYFEVYSLG